MNVTAGSVLIKLDGLVYPLTLAQVRALEPDTSFAAEPSEEALAEFGYALVHPQERPAGDVVTEGTPVLEGGQWNQVWQARAYTPEELEAELSSRRRVISSQMDALRESKLAEGFPYDFGAEYGVQHVQLRSEDIVNLLCLRMGAEEYVAAGAPDSVMELRTREDNEIDVMASDMLSITRVALLYGMKVYKAAWAVKNQAKAATTIAALPEVPAELTIE